MLYFTISLLILVVVTLIIHISYAPLIDITRDGKIVLWYGRKERKFIVLKD
jgi:hypothetical protein